MSDIAWKHIDSITLCISATAVAITWIVMYYRGRKG